MSIVGQHESIVAGAPVVPRYVDAVMDTAPIVVIHTFIHIWNRKPVLLLKLETLKHMYEGVFWISLKQDKKKDISILYL